MFVGFLTAARPCRRNLENGNDTDARIPPEETAAWHARLKKAEEDLPPLMTRLDALNEAIDDGWCPSRIVKNELSHLFDVLNAYHLRKYPTETRQTLDDAEAELATWRTLSEAARDEIWKADERADAEAAERRKARQEAVARKNAIYETAKRTGMPLSPAMEDALAWIA
jgi:hypothetical protein